MRAIAASGQRRRATWLAVVGALAVAAAGCGSTTSAGQPVASGTASAAAYFKGKTIQFIIPHPVGGGFDIYSRLVIKYMEKFMPGTTIVPVNRVGAGGLLGSKEIFTAKPNGLTIGILSGPGLALTQVVDGTQKAGYNLADVSWIGRVSADTPAIAVGTHSPVQSFSQWQHATQPLKFAQSGAGSGDYISVKVISHVLKLPAEVIAGFKGSAADNQAVLSGTVDATESSLGSLRTEVVNHEFKPILIVGPSPRKLAPGVPTLVQVAKQYSATVQKDMDAWANMEAMNRSIGGPPGIPKARLDYLRQVFGKVMHDSAFIAQAAKAHRELAYMSGASYHRLVVKELTALQHLKPLLLSIPGVK